MRAKHIEQVMVLTTKNVNLKAHILDTVKSVCKDPIQTKVLAPGKYAIDVEPIVPRFRNNREAHLDYLRHFKESVETIRDIVEEAKVVRPLDSSIVSACRVNRCTDASGSQPRSNTKKNRISPDKGVNKLQVEEQPRTNKSPLRTSNRVDSSSRPKRTISNSNSDSVCQTCNKCLIFANHDICVVDYLKSVMAPPLFVIIVMVCAKLSKFRNLSKLGKYGNLQAKSLPLLVINGDPLTDPRTLQQNGVVERQNHTLVEAARTMLIFSKAPMFLWAEVVATACVAAESTFMGNYLVAPVDNNP
nr:putative ribonuclease H-like domain-containing protein [Tanacetum cinerariifolium]